MGHSCLSISDFTTPGYSHRRCCHSIIISVISYYTIFCKSVCINWIFTVFNSFFFVNISTCKYFYCFIPQLTLFPSYYKEKKLSNLSFFKIIVIYLILNLLMFFHSHLSSLPNHSHFSQLQTSLHKKD